MVNPHPELERLRKEQEQRIQEARLKQLSQSHFDIMKVIEGKEPKYAKHMFLRNELVEKFAKHTVGGVNILEQPVCIHCEKPAAWNEGGSAYCFACGKDTPKEKVVTVRAYLIDQLKGFDEDKLELLSLGGDYDETVKHISI